MVVLCTSVSVITRQIVGHKDAPRVCVTGIGCTDIVVIAYDCFPIANPISTLVACGARIIVVAVQFVCGKDTASSWVTGVVCAGVVVLAFNITAGHHQAASADALGDCIVAKTEIVVR